jgi:hypothetical protein
MFLSWHQSYRGRGPTAPVTITVYDCDLMQPLEELPHVNSSPLGTTTIFYSQGGIVSSVDIPTTETGKKTSFLFPKPINQIDELLILGHSSEITDAPCPEKNNCSLIIVHPKDSNFEIIPQDWFNKGTFDYGYQWISRVAREPKTGRIIGEGVRLGIFKLDKSMRNIDKWINKETYLQMNT